MSNRIKKKNSTKLPALPAVRWVECLPNGRPKAKSMMNARQAIAMLRLDCRFDCFNKKYFINSTNLDRFTGEVSDKVTRKIRELAFATYGYDPGKDATFEAVLRACEENWFHPILDYFDGLPKWDGVPRVATWLTTYLGVEDTPLHRAWAMLVLVAAIRRIKQPGCKFDHILILEGPEGKGKSSVVQILASGELGGTEHFSDSPLLNVDEKKQMELTAGVWFYEIAELAGLSRADAQAVKNFVTRQVERARPAYGRFLEEQPRTCIFIASFNTTDNSEVIEYLNVGDHRRWWPVIVGTIDTNGLMRDRDQLFAEAMIVEGFDEIPMRLDEALWGDAKKIQTSREISDPLADRLSTLYPDVCDLWRNKSHVPGTLVTDDWAWVSGKYVLEQLPTSNADSRRVVAAMRKMGWRSVNDRRSGAPLRGYEKKHPDPLEE